MKAFKYLIVGGGIAADSAVRGIRQLDGSGEIAVIGAEAFPPYDRPPLSKGLWKGKPLDSIWRDTHGAGVTLILGRMAAKVDVAGKTVTDSAGEIYRYDRLLLATGGTPRRLGGADDEVIYFRTVDDYRKLRELADRGGEFAVIGGGFIGTELAAALAMSGRRVTLLFPGPGIGARAYPSGLSAFLDGYFRSNGVTVLAGQTAKAVRRTNSTSIVETMDGHKIAADGVVAGLGIQPDVALAQSAGIAVRDGIVVDEFLQTTAPGVYAAGDVASFFSPILEKRLRVEHEDNANVMGETAGRNMAGETERYHYLPFFYSDLFDLGYEAVGELDSSLDTVEDWLDPFRKGVVYYLRGGRVRGVLLWNTWNQVAAATQLISAKARQDPKSLVGRIRDAS